MVVLTSKQMREVESRVKEGGIEMSRLIFNAGSAAARIIREKIGVSDRRITIVCGSGNNGADGLVVAQKLYEAGADITVVLACGDPKTIEAKEMLSRIINTSIPILHIDRNPTEIKLAIKQAGIIVDGIFGISFRDSVGPQLFELFKLINESLAIKVSLDLPSGTHCDTGLVDEYCIKADFTIAFTTLKPAHVTYPAAGYCGRFIVANIGISDKTIERVSSSIQVVDRDMISKVIKPRRPDGHKGDYGRVVCVCGSVGMTGAAILSSKAAVRSGAGIVALAIGKSCLPQVAAQLVEPIFYPMDENEKGTLSSSCKTDLLNRIKYAQACLVGCGLGSNSDIKDIVSSVVQNSNCPLIIDADGINAIVGNINILKDAKAPIVLTPHPGEMAALLGVTISKVQSNRIHTASQFAKKYNVIVVLKGANTVIANTDGKIFINTTGNPGMAKGGSGDVLAGMVASFIAQGISPIDAAICATYLHGAAGDKTAKRLSQHSMTPSDMLDNLPLMFLEFER